MMARNSLFERFPASASSRASSRLDSSIFLSVMSITTTTWSSSGEPDSGGALISTVLSAPFLHLTVTSIGENVVPVRLARSSSACHPSVTCCR